MGRFLGWLRAAWLTLEEPRWVTAVQLGIYAIATGLGVVTAFVPPTSLVAAWGQPLTTAWSVLSIVGGALAALGCYTGQWWLEARGLWLLWLAIALRILLVAALHVATPGNRITQLAELTMLLACFVIRWLRIKDVPIDPAKATP